MDYFIILAISLVLAFRWGSLLLPNKFLQERLDFVPKTTLIMIWGGLRGGIFIALALGLTQEMERDLFLVMTSIVMVFSILVQGLTVEKLVKKFAT